MREQDAPRSESGHLPVLLNLAGVKARLASIFPDAFANRAILTGEMAARVVYVFLYGGFVQGQAHLLRPSHVYFFTREQADKTSVQQRLNWRRDAGKPGFRHAGQRWYADNSRETIRDDLMRNTMLRLGIASKQAGIAVTSSKPSWYLDGDFASLFEPSLQAAALDAALLLWRKTHLNAGELQRMALRAEGVQRQTGDLLIAMPDGSRIRVSAGPSSLIAKGVVERFASKHLRDPAVLWLSVSDRKTYPQFVELAAKVGLRFDANAVLPDIILADIGQPVKFIFFEVVASDGPVTEARRAALTEIIQRSHVPMERVTFITAYEDRNAAPFKKNVSELALNSYVWFRTEPNLLLHLTTEGLAP